MRATTALAAGGLACAGAAMTIAAFAGGGSDPSPAPGAPARAAVDGESVWIAQGCGSCHTFEPANSSSPIGPDLQLSLHGKDRDYVMESIVLPYKAVSAGYDGMAMPDDFAKRMSPAELEALVDFVYAGVQQG